MKVSILDRLEAVGAAAWTQLVVGSRLPTPFASYVWHREWVRAFAPAARLEIRKVEDDDGQLVAVLPLVETAPGTLHLVGGVDVSDYLDLIVRRGREEEVWAALLQSRAGSPAVWELHSVPAESPTVQALPKLAEAAGMSGTVAVEERCPVLTLPRTWEAYLATLSGRHRHELTRKIRRFEREAPEGRVFCASRSAELDARLGDFLDLHRRSRVGKARFMDARMEEFFRRVTGLLAERDSVRMWFLDLPQGPVAAFLCLEWDGVVGLYNSGFHPTYAALAPGLVLLAHVIRDAIARGKRQFDFLRGEERYKYEFGPVPEDVCLVTLQPAGGDTGVSLRVAMLSVHTCPLAALGGKETGGMNVYVREVSRELGRMGVVVDVFTRSQNATIPQVVRLGDRARVVHLPAGPQAPMAKERVYDHIDAFVDGVDEWRMVRGLDYDLVHGHYWLSGVAALELRARWSVPVLQMFHTLARLKNGVARALSDLEPDVRIVEETRVVGEVDRVVAANEVERAHLIEHYAARRERIAVIPCGVDTELFAPGDRATARATLGLDGRPTVLYVGRMTPIKGLDTLLDAVATLRARMPDARLLVVGGETDEHRSDHEGALRERCRRLGLESTVQFIRAQPQEVLRTFYVAADVTVLPSHYESFGMVALEAMACGGAVIASRVGGLTTTVLDGITGLLVPEGDADTLAARLAELLARPELRGRLGREGVRWAARHRWPCVAEAVCREYTSLAGRGREHLAVARCHE